MIRLSTLVLLITLLIGCAAPEAPVARLPEDRQYVSGTVGFGATSLSGVTWIVDEVQSIPNESIPEYSYVILSVSVINNSDLSLLPPESVLVDEYSNQYANWRTNVNIPNLIGLPSKVNPGEFVSGQQAFQVPTAALSQNLRLRWDSETHNVRTEIFLNDIQ